MRLRRRSENDDSHKALKEAQSHIEEVKSRDREVQRVSNSLRKIRERNHFADQIYTIMNAHSEGKGR